MFFPCITSKVVLSRINYCEKKSIELKIRKNSLARIIKNVEQYIVNRTIN